MFSISTRILFLILLLVSHSDARLDFLSFDESIINTFPSFLNLQYVALTPQNKFPSGLFHGQFNGNDLLSNACEPLPTFPTYDDDNVRIPVVVAAWGGCHIAQKVMNAELAGAKMFIVVLPDGMPLDHPSLRQLPIKSSIEVLAIMNTADVYWKEILQKFQNRPKDDPGSVVTVYYFFEPERNIHYRSDQKEGDLVIDYWMSVNDPSNRSYEYLKDLKEILSYFGTSLKFNAHYVIWEDKDLIKSGKFFNREDCLSGGRYCDADFKSNDDSRNLFYGKDAIMETLRQICLRDLEDQAPWWSYIENFMSGCLGASKYNNRNCYKKVSESANIAESVAYKVEACMLESFEASKGEDLQETVKENLKLKLEAYDMDLMKINQYPSLYINNIEYKGSLRNKEILLNFICLQFSAKENAPNICPNGRGKSGSTLRDIVVYWGVSLGSVIGSVFIIYCVRRAVKREVASEVSNEIPRIVARYRTFRNEADSNNADTNADVNDERENDNEQS